MVASTFHYLFSYQSVTVMHSSGHTAASMQKALAKFKRSLKLQLKLARESSPVASVHVTWQLFVFVFGRVRCNLLLLMLLLLLFVGRRLHLVCLEAWQEGGVDLLAVSMCQQQVPHPCTMGAPFC